MKLLKVLLLSAVLLGTTMKTPARANGFGWGLAFGALVAAPRSARGQAVVDTSSGAFACVAEARLRSAQGDREGALAAARRAVTARCAEAGQELARLLQGR